ncbi:Fe-S protein assembly co-chaperone HscB [Roseateles terrae]|uniref:Co-chaperone protein HscB homolog n=1 Tax=Roseateles terrae TaxID=431060 RepID=A0ABR6GKP2_9BURK|nr:Fe-S protein assembly co-chaperone HscB [Roseateles terrae]MBB3192677.1 molecular chaperone HscB [Roseateles terrae]OWQ90035.1 Fe-S protein assembly co-chaperone HscB [Roseateles terrae]
MKLDDDDFALFGLPARFEQDSAEIAARWKALAAKVHPDKFAAEGAASQRLAMQWSLRVNEAYQRLKDPLKRAAYLCELRGAPIEANENTAMPAAFLMEQMEWRESLDEARDSSAILAIDREVASRERSLLTQAGTALDQRQQPQEAAQAVRALMFLTRFRADIDRRLESLDPAT